MSWSDFLIPASFNGVNFHIESGGHAGGRRIVDFEFPKSDTNYVEDMGRKGRHFTIAAYLIGDDFALQRDALIAAMETEGPGLLIHPTMGEFLVNPENYQVTETRTRGRMCELELTFVEAGGGADALTGIAATSANVGAAADTAGAAAAASADAALAALKG